MAGRIEVLKEMYAEKTIDKKLYIKYQQTPDIPGMFSELNSDVDAIQGQLDALIKSDEYIPPSPYMDFPFAIQTAENRFSRALADKSPQAVLDRLSMWIATVKNMQAQNTTPPSIPQPPAPGPGAGPVPAPGGFGLQPPAEAPNIAPIAPAPILPPGQSPLNPSVGG